jgi:molybdenum cofactor cytidylyltransferase
MTTSFQAGIRALPSDVTALVVCLVDHPLVSARTVVELLRHADASDIVVPTFEGRRGHPVVFSPSFMRAILELPADRGVNSLIREQGRVLEIPVPDPGIVTDIDTPGELGRAGGRLPGPPRPGAD